ncbi:GNAT family N-acetyltransferase [Paracoccus sp. YIM 132242]|uniref:GNAT family N-acetyltransferase n=1 Tax=Paracoccus lichenicola TaxID=2665644 RepID=A0A6L6HIV3_9RHOB|nr:GNAT family N-acetyltransferase [Paracoccus lichenicola]MTD99096.1 GNAT family N-acetyltransferase [Paracoccus lichenicola]
MSARLALTRPWPEDAPAIAEALSDWQVARWLTAVPWPYRPADAAAFINDAGLDEYAVRQDGRLVGMVRASGSFGIWMAPFAQGQGLAERAAVLALSRRFRGGAAFVEANHLEDNTASAALLARLGFRPTGQVLLWSEPQQRQLPGLSLRLTREDFARRHAVALATPRLLIEPFRPADLPDLHRIATLPAVAANLLLFHPAMTPDDMAPLFQSDGLLPPMRLTVRHGGRVAGSIGISAGDPPRIFYFLDPVLSGQGLGEEMGRAFLAEITARFDPPELLADVFLDNQPSRRLLKNLGFQRDLDQMLSSLGRSQPAPAAIYRWRRRPQP